MENKPLTLEPYIFKYIADKLDGASPDKIVAWYIENLIFKNGDYLKELMKRYHLPNDLLKLHERIIELAKEG